MSVNLNGGETPRALTQTTFSDEIRTFPLGSGVCMHNYDNPAKNWLRSRLFATVDRFFEGNATANPLRAVYLPGVQNLEGPCYASRGITAYAVERDTPRIREMCSARKSKHPLTLKDVFQGSLGDFAVQHAHTGGLRLHIVNADFEGKIHSYANELIGLFRIFPSKQGGILSVTTFANQDHDSVQSGIVFSNIFDSLVDGEVKKGLDALHAQLLPYIRQHGDSRTFCHGQLCRDFGILWRVLMGLTLFESPANLPGNLNVELHQAISARIGAMFLTASRLNGLLTRPAFFTFQEPGLTSILERCRTSVFPLAIERYLYHSGNHKRMSTWIITFGRHSREQNALQVARQLWHLYRVSPLTFVKNNGTVATYLSG